MPSIARDCQLAGNWSRRPAYKRQHRINKLPVGSSKLEIKPRYHRHCCFSKLRLENHKNSLTLPSTFYVRRLYNWNSKLKKISIRRSTSLLLLQLRDERRRQNHRRYPNTTLTLNFKLSKKHLTINSLSLINMSLVVNPVSDLLQIKPCENYMLDNIEVKKKKFNQLHNLFLLLWL